MKKIGKYICVVVAILAISCSMTSCDEDFWEGFEQGWNSTAPPDYRI